MLNRRNLLKGLFALGAGLGITSKVSAIGLPSPSETIPTTGPMPVELPKKETGAWEHQMIAIDHIVVDPITITPVTKHQKELREHIRQNGILNPILVRPLHNGLYAVVDGLCRFRAAQELSLKELPCVIREMSRESVIDYRAIRPSNRVRLSRHERRRIRKVQWSTYVNKDQLKVRNCAR